MEPYSFYRIYKPSKLHFSQVKFKLSESKVRVSEEEFLKLSFLHAICSFSGNVKNPREAARYCVSNFAVKDFWLSDDHQLIKNRAELWKAYRKNPEAMFVNDLRSIKESTGVTKSSILVSPTKSGVLPPVLQLYIGEKISADFVTILDLANPFLDNLTDFWFDKSGAKLRLTKNREFVKLDEAAAKHLVSTIFTEF